MSNRRNFLKISMVAAAAMAGNRVFASPGKGDKLPDNIIYTEDNLGRFAKKVGSHLPVVTVDGNKITMKTEHGMSEAHYIVRHTLVAENGEVLGEKTFHFSDPEAVSVFEITGDHSKLYATSFCNKHDLWINEVSL